jgi:hypothetical protein
MGFKFPVAVVWWLDFNPSVVVSICKRAMLSELDPAYAPLQVQYITSKDYGSQ